MDKVVMVRTASGEFILGFRKEPQSTIVEPGGTHREVVSLKQARIFSVQRTANGPAIALIPIVPFVSDIKKYENIDLDISQVYAVVEEEDLDGEVVNAYKSNVTGIDLSAANTNKNVII